VGKIKLLEILVKLKKIGKYLMLKLRILKLDLELDLKSDSGLEWRKDVIIDAANGRKVRGLDVQKRETDGGSYRTHLLKDCRFE